MNKITIIYIIILIIVIFTIYYKNVCRNEKYQQISINKNEHFSSGDVVWSSTANGVYASQFGFDAFGYLYIPVDNWITPTPEGINIVFINPITKSIVHTYNIGTKIEYIEKDLSGNLHIATNGKMLLLSASSRYSEISTVFSSTTISNYCFSVDSSGTYYACIGNLKMLKIDSNGNVTDFCTFPRIAWGSAIDLNRNIYCVGPYNNTLWKLNSSGIIIGTYTSLLSIPIYVFCLNGYTYVINQGNRALIRFDSDGNATSVLDSTMTSVIQGYGQVSYGAMDNTGSIYYLDDSNQKITKFASPTASTTGPTVKLGVPLSSLSPKTSPSVAPKASPSIAPKASPSIAPSVAPSVAPKASPSIAPSVAPSVAPKASPSIGLLNIKLTFNNNILTCQPGDTIQLVNFTSTNPLTLSYNNIVINKFTSTGNGLFILDPTSISTTPISTYQLPNFVLKNVKLSSPDMPTPLLLSDISIIPIYT